MMIKRIFQFCRAHGGCTWVIGLSLTLLVLWGLRLEGERSRQAQLATTVDQVANVIEQRFHLFEYGLRGARGAIVATGLDRLRREDFERYIASRDPAYEFPGAMGFGFIRRVPVEQEAEFLARARADGAPDFSIRALQPHTGDRYIIQYIYPQQPNRQAVGLDIASENNRRHAALAAARDGQASLTEPITLVQSGRKPNRGFLILLPVYAGGVQPQTPEAREWALEGWVYAPLVVDDVLADLQTELQSLMGQAVLTLSIGDNEPFYRSATTSVLNDAAPHITHELRVLGQQWRMELVPVAEDALLDDSGQTLGVLLLGMVLTFLASLISRPPGAQGERSEDDGIAADFSLQAFWRHDLSRRPWLVVVTGGILILIVAAVGIAQYQLQTVHALLVEQLGTAREQFSDTADRYRRDVRFLAGTPPIAGLLRTSAAGGVVVDGSSNEQWKSRLSDIFAAYMQANPEVLKVRLLGAESGWRELVRLNRMGSGLERVDNEALQVRSGESYIDRTLLMGAGQVYVSTIDLNHERGVPQRPYTPVWSFSMPFFHEDGRPFAILVINVKAENLLLEAAGQQLPHEAFYVTNAQGDFLGHPQPALTFNFEFGKPYRWNDEFRTAGIGLDINGFSRWTGRAGGYWVGTSTFVPNEGSQAEALTIHAAHAEWPVYQRMLWWLSGVLLLLLFLLLLGVGWHYRKWWFAQHQKQEQWLREEDELRSREAQFFKGLLDSAPDATLIVNDQGIIELANAQAVLLFGYSREQFAGMPVTRLLPARYAADHGRHFQSFVQNPATRPMGMGRTFPACKADGSEFPAQISLGPVELPDRMLVYASVNDVTQQLEIEEQLRRALQAAEEASEAKSAFLANTSHEIRTPLNAIIGLTHLLMESVLNEAQRNLTRKIQSAGKILLGIVSDVLDLSKIEAGEVELERLALNLPELLEEVADTFRLQAEARELNFELTMAPELPRWVESDPVRLRQILLNLLSNALKFTEQGGIGLSAEVLASAAGEVEVRLSVTDTGIGIAPEVQARLFNPFSQADASMTRRFGGTGLGLSIVKRLAELLGGQVGVNSEEGKGSCFWVELKLPLVSRQEQEQSYQSMMLLIAAGQEEDAEQLQSLCADLGWRSNRADDCEEVLAFLQNRMAKGLRLPDVVILDEALLTDAGLQSLEAWLQQAGPDNRPAVLLLESGEPVWAARLEQAGMTCELLYRPLHHSLMFTQVNELVTRHTGNTERVLQCTRTEAVKALWLLGMRVLVVDDSPVNLEVVTQLLVRNGAVVTALESGQAAVECLQARPDDFDAVLMDVQMPGMDGLEATRRIRQLPGLDSLPILALTAGAFMQERRSALEAGMNDFLSKPIDPSLLISHLRLAVENRTGQSIAVEPMSVRPLGESAASAGAEWPQINGLNAAQGKRYLEGDAAMLLSLLQQMLDEHANLAGPVPDMIDSAEAMPLRRQISAQLHRLRSVAGTIGAERIQQLATRGEQELLQEAVPATGLLQQLAQALCDLKAASADLLDAVRRDRVAQLESASQSGEGVSPEVLQQLLQALSGQDLAALDMVAEYSAGLYVAMGQAGFEAFDQCLQHLEFEKAHALLSPLSER